VNLGADIAFALPELRAQAESKMVDSCTIVADIESGDPDPATGKPNVTRTTVYAGKCEFKAGDTQARSVASGGRDLVQQGAVLKIPVEATGSCDVQAGHEATIVLATFDATSPPIIARISGGHRQTSATARRLPVEVTGNG
jgi:hypothetical protein